LPMPVNPSCQDQQQQLPRLQKRLHISPNGKNGQHESWEHGCQPLERWICFQGQE
jgi:hypothetical protein